MNFCSLGGTFDWNRAVSAASIVASVSAVPAVPTGVLSVKPAYRLSRSLSIFCAIAATDGCMYSFSRSGTASTSHPVPVLIDLAAFRLVGHLLEVRNQFLALAVYHQLNLACRGPQSRVHQVDPVPYIGVAPRRQMLHSQGRVTPEVLADHLVVRTPRGLLRVPRRVSVNLHPCAVLFVALQELLARLVSGSVPDHNLVQ